MVEYDIGTPYVLDLRGDNYQVGGDRETVPYSYVPGNVQIFGNRGFAVDTGIRIDDNQIGDNILWSSSKTNSKTNHTGQFGNFAIFDGKGQLFDSNTNSSTVAKDVLNSISNELLNDLTEAATSEAANLAIDQCYTTIQPMVTSMIDNKLNTVPVFNEKNIPMFSSIGQLEDSKISINSIVNLQNKVNQSQNVTQQEIAGQVQNMFTLLKSETDSSISKIASSLNDNISTSINQTNAKMDNFMFKGVNTKSGNTAIFNSSGQVLDSGIDIMQMKTEMDNAIQDLSSTIYVPAMTNPNNIPVFDGNGQLTDSKVNVTNVMPKTINAVANNISIFNGDGTLSDSNYKIDDSIVSLKNLWSSAAIQSELDEKINRPQLFQTGNVAIFNADGQLRDGGPIPTIPKITAPSKTLPIVTMDSYGMSVESNLSINDVQVKVIPKNVNNIAILDQNGGLKDSDITIDDTIAASPKILWSSIKQKDLFDQKLNKIPQYTAGNIPMFDGNGNIIDSTLSAENVVSVAECKRDCEERIKTLVPIKAGAIPTLRSDGQVSDSNVLVSELQLKLPPSNVNNIAILDAQGQVVDSSFRFNDVLNSNKVVWSSEKIISELDKKLNTCVVYTDGNIPVFNASGQLQDSRINSSSLYTTIDDKISSLAVLSKPSANVNAISLWDGTGQQKDSGIKIEQVMLKPQSQSLLVNTLPIFDVDGQVAGSGISINDKSGPDSTTLWTSIKSQQLLDSKINKPVKSASGDLSMFDSDGNIIDSGISITTLKSQLANVSELKGQPLVVPSKPNSFPILGIDGVIADSQKSFEDILAKPLNSTLNHIATFDGIGQVQDSGLIMQDDATTTTNVWSANKIQSKLDKKLNTLSLYNVGNIPIIGADGQLVDSNSSFINLIPSIPAQGNSISMLSSEGKIIDSGIGRDSLLTVPSIYNSNNLCSFDSQGKIIDSSYFVNDTLQPSTQIMYSSNKIKDLVNQKLTRPTNTRIDGIATFNDSGEIVDSGILITSLLTKTDLNSYQIKQNAIAGNLAVWNPDKQTVDSYVKIDDSANPSPNVLYTSQRLLIRPNVQGIAGDFASFDNTGQIVDSTYYVDDISSPKSNVLYSSVKIDQLNNLKLNAPSSSATSGNITIFGLNNNVIDSGVSLQSLQSPLNSIPAVPSATNENIAIFNYSGGVVDSNKKIDDAALPSSNVIYSSVKVDGKISKVSGGIAGNIPILDGNGELIDSGKSAINLQENGMKLVQSTISNEIAFLDENGQVIKSNMTVDDTKVGSLTLWSSNKINSALQSIQQGSASGIKIGGTGSTVGICKPDWFRVLLNGSTNYANSLLSVDKLAVKVPKDGTFLFTFFVDEAKNFSTYFAIHLRTTPLTPATRPYESSPNTNTEPQQNSIMRLFTLKAGDEVDFRIKQNFACTHMTGITWLMEELS